MARKGFRLITVSGEIRRSHGFLRARGACSCDLLRCNGPHDVGNANAACPIVAAQYIYPFSSISLSKTRSFQKIIPRWVKKVEEEVRQGQCHICIVGTKADLLRDNPSALAVTAEACLDLTRPSGHLLETYNMLPCAQDVQALKDELAPLCGENTPDFFETSAKDNLGIAGASNPQSHLLANLPSAVDKECKLA